MNDVHDNARQHQADLGSAVTRGRRAAAEARERAERFRRRSKELADESQRDGRPDSASETDRRCRESAAEFRTRVGFPVEEFTEPVPAREFPGNVGESTRAQSRESHQQTLPDEGDEDFSHPRILR
jgi:hypothetical protein